MWRTKFYAFIKLDNQVILLTKLFFFRLRNLNICMQINIFLRMKVKLFYNTLIDITRIYILNNCSSLFMNLVFFCYNFIKSNYYFYNRILCVIRWSWKPCYFVTAIDTGFTTCIHREKQQPLTLQAPKHPHGTSPTCGVHPQTSQPRPLRYGNDNTSVNRQTRTQSTRPDPIPG